MNTNIVEIKVKNQSIIKTRQVYQWDSGQVLKVIDKEVPDNTEVQFGTETMQQSIIARMVDNQVTIPQDLMEQPSEITAYMVIVKSDSETTVKVIRIPMVAKPRPSGYDQMEEVIRMIQAKADKSGWTPDKYLGTDAEGNIVEKESLSVPTKISQLENDKNFISDVDISAEQTSEGVNITIGSKTATLFNGKDGKDGSNGRDGADGYTPQKGIDYFDGENGQDGKDGQNGKDGADGYTPVKGVDYFDGADGYTPVKGVDYYTEADKTEMVQAVIAAMPTAEGGAY